MRYWCWCCRYSLSLTAPPFSLRYNEAGGPLSHPPTNGAGCKNKPLLGYKIPAALDWFSIDMYHMDGHDLKVNWVDLWPRKFYTEQIYPNLTATQKVVLVPGSFGSTVNHYPNGTYVCDKDCYDQMCAHDAANFYAWAQEDKRVAVIAPWNWGGCATCNGSHWTPPHTCWYTIARAATAVLLGYWCSCCCCQC